MSRRKARRSPLAACAVYDGHRLLASAWQFRPDGLWHAHDAHSVCMGAFPSREQALGFMQARFNRLAAAPLDRERERDIERVNKIRSHQRAEGHRKRKALRAERRKNKIS